MFECTCLTLQTDEGQSSETAEKQLRRQHDERQTQHQLLALRPQPEHRRLTVKPADATQGYFAPSPHDSGLKVCLSAD